MHTLEAPEHGRRRAEPLPGRTTGDPPGDNRVRIGDGGDQHGVHPFGFASPPHDGFAFIEMRTGPHLTADCRLPSFSPLSPSAHGGFCELTAWPHGLNAC